MIIKSVITIVTAHDVHTIVKNMMDKNYIAIQLDVNYFHEALQ